MLPVLVFAAVPQFLVNFQWLTLRQCQIHVDRQSSLYLKNGITQRHTVSVKGGVNWEFRVLC